MRPRGIPVILAATAWAYVWMWAAAADERDLRHEIAQALGSGRVAVVAVAPHEADRGSEWLADHQAYLGAFRASAAETFRFFEIGEDQVNGLLESEAEIAVPASIIALRGDGMGVFSSGPVFEPSFYEFLTAWGTGAPAGGAAALYAEDAVPIRLRPEP